MTTRKVLVTGVYGFLGRHIDKRLETRGIRILGHRKDLISADVTEMDKLDSFKKQGLDTIIHLAAKSSVSDSFKRPYEVYRTNVLGTLNVLELARLENVKKLIFVSTYVYGRPTYVPIDEKHPINPYSPYHLSKVLAERICESYSEVFGINVVTFRAFNIYGPNSKSHQFIPSIISRIRNGGVLLSREKTKRDLLYVEDFIDLIERVLDKFPGGYNMYNVGSGECYTASDVCSVLAGLINKKITIRYDEKTKPEDLGDIVADITKVSKKFNWKPSTDLKKGLSKCIGSTNLFV
jgi:UDP-glucose 4-epimerase